MLLLTFVCVCVVWMAPSLVTESDAESYLLAARIPATPSLRHRFLAARHPATAVPLLPAQGVCERAKGW